MSLIAAHGGKLVDRILKPDAAAKAKQDAAEHAGRTTFGPRGGRS